MTVDHVAEVEDPRDGLPRFIDEDVVVVRVAVDDTLPEVREHRDDMGRMVRGQLRDPCRDRGVRDHREIRTHHAVGVREIPMEVAMEGCVIKGRERLVHATERATQIATECVRVQWCRAEGRAGKRRDEPNETGTVLGDLGAVDRTDEPRCESARLQVTHDRTLGFEHLTPLRDVGQLQDEALSRLCAEEDVLVAFGREVRRHGPHAVEALGECGRVGEREVGHAGQGRRTRNCAA